MEDCNTLVSDVIVVSCCCQCLILQLIIFIFVHLPRKIARKTKEYAKKKLTRTRKESKGNKHEDSHNHNRHRQRIVGYDEGRSESMKVVELEGVAMSRVHRWGSCSDEVDKVLGELAMKGEFAFGSFWHENKQENIGFCCKCSRTLTKENVLQFDSSHLVRFHFIDVVGP